MKVRTDKAAQIAAALIAAVAIGAPALAHHAFQAEFDGNQPIMLQGKVTKVEWINPHTWVHMIVVTDGVPQEWMVEAGTPNTLLREGLTRDSLKAGRGNHRARLPGQGRALPSGLQGQRARCHIHRRPQGIHGIERHRRAERRRGSERKIV